LRVTYLSAIIVLIDQITKMLVKGIRIPFLGINILGIPYGSSKSVIGEFIKITFIENPGMAFGLDIGPKMFLTLFTIIASLIILYYIFKHRNDALLLRVSLAFILAGAVGNLLDRIFYGTIYNYAPLFYGKVVDFIQVDTWDFTIFGRTFTTWPIFNVADVSVTIGFLIILFFNKKIFKHDKLEPALNEDSNIINPDVLINYGEVNENNTEKIDENTLDIKRPLISNSIIKSGNYSLENSEKLNNSGSEGPKENQD
jgi:signal peptidase II